jgi:hypothetical protein
VTRLQIYSVCVFFCADFYTSPWLVEPCTGLGITLLAAAQHPRSVFAPWNVAHRTGISA